RQFLHFERLEMFVVEIRLQKNTGKMFSNCGIFMEVKLRKRSEEHTSELQSRENLVCRLLLEKKKKQHQQQSNQPNQQPPAPEQSSGAPAAAPLTERQPPSTPPPPRHTSRHTCRRELVQRTGG